MWALAKKMDKENLVSVSSAEQAKEEDIFRDSPVRLLGGLKLPIPLFFIVCCRWYCRICKRARRVISACLPRFSDTVIYCGVWLRVCGHTRQIPQGQREQGDVVILRVFAFELGCVEMQAEDAHVMAATADTLIWQTLVKLNLFLHNMSSRLIIGVGKCSHSRFHNQPIGERRLLCICFIAC